MKTLVNIFLVTAVAVIIGFGFTACDNGTTGGTWFSETVFETIPASSGLRGTTWRNESATGSSTVDFMVSADGKAISWINADDLDLTRYGDLVSVTVITTDGEDYTTYVLIYIRRDTENVTITTLNVRPTYLTIGTSATQYIKQ